MDDHEFNTLKFSFPFWIKNDKQRFFKELDNIYNIIDNLSEIQIIDLFYTLHAIGISKIWISFLFKIIDKIKSPINIDILKLASFYIYEDEDLIKIKNNYKKIIKNCKCENDILNICFIDRKFFKPLLFSKFKNMKMINDDLNTFLINLCYENIKTPDNKIICLEKIVSIRKLTDSEIDILFEYIKDVNYSGKIIDILLRTNDTTLVTKAMVYIQNDNEIIELKDHSVHYFKIKDEYLNKIKIFNVNMEDIFEIINMAIIFGFSEQKLNDIYNIINMIITSTFNINNEKLLKIFSYFWSLCTFDEKQILINDFVDSKDICCSGFLINYLYLLGAIKSTDYLEINEKFTDEKNKIDILKKKYTEDDDFWNNPELIKKELNVNNFSK